MAVWSIIEAEQVSDSARWDAEYFSPDNLRLAATLAKQRPKRIDSFADVTDGIHGSPEWVDEGITYLSAKCVREHVVNITVAGQISRAQDSANPRTRARIGDVVITSVGTIGNAAVIENWMLPANMDRHLGIIRIRDSKRVDPYFLATFLNCEFGRFQSLRESTGNVQLNLFIQKIRGIQVPIATRFQKVAALVRRVYEAQRAADLLYPEAQAELLDRLGWEEMQTQKVELSYVRDFAELATATRADAEFFQPQYSRLCRLLSKRGAHAIGTFCPKPSRGVQPVLVEDGSVMVVDSKAVRLYGVEPSAADRTSRALHDSPANQKGRLRRNDVLLNSTGRGTLGRAGWYQLDEPALCDNHVTILRPHPEICNPIYLSLFLNSPAGRAQSEQFQTGSSGQLEIYPQHIQQFLVYLPQQKNGFVDLAWQKKLAAKVQAASSARVAASERLEEAKRLVEEAIE